MCDLFENIRCGYEGKPSVFDSITHEDLIIAFFPCTRFENQIQMWFAGNCYSQRKWNDLQKIEYDMKLHEELAENYSLICKLFHICISRNLKLIVENPYSSDHYLVRYFPIKSTLIHKDRSCYGDYYKKPTQYWFVNCKPVQNFIFGEHLKNYDTKTIAHTHNQVKRSLISPTYANRFIRQYLIVDKNKLI